MSFTHDFGKANLLMLAMAWAGVQGAAVPLIGLGMPDESTNWAAWLSGIYFLAGIVTFPVPSILLKHLKSDQLARIATLISSIALVPLGFGFSPWLSCACRGIHGFSATILLVAVETELLKKAKAGNRSGNLGTLEVCLVIGAGLGASLSPLLWSINPQLSGLIPAIPAFILSAFSLKLPFIDHFQSSHSESGGEKNRSLVFILLATSISQGLAEGALMGFLATELVERSWTESMVSTAFGCLFGGIILSQLILTKVADYQGTNSVLFLWHIGVGLGFGILGWTSMPIVILTGLLLVGFGLGCQYPIAQASLADTVADSSKLAKAASIFLAANTIGCFLSSPIFGSIIAFWGMPAVYNFLSAISLSVGFTGILIAGIIDQFNPFKEVDRPSGR